MRISIPSLFLIAFVLSAAAANAAPGDLDASFNASGDIPGVAQTDIIFGQEDARSMALQPDGKIVVAGGFFNTGTHTHHLVVGRFNADGTIDTSFGTPDFETAERNGFFLSSNEEANAVALQSNGKIIVAGRHSLDLLILRLNADGTLDTTFGNAINPTGRNAFDFGGNDDEALALTIREDDRILVAGRSKDDAIVADFTAEGLLNKVSFGPDNGVTTDGVIRKDFGGADVARSIALQSDGKIVIAGGTDEDFFTARILADGSALDASFSGDGFDVADFFSAADVANSVLVQPDGKIITVGTSGPTIALARYGSNGSPDADFGLLSTPGRTTVILENDAQGNAAALQSDGKILVGGTTDHELFVVRLCEDGNPDNGAICGDGFGGSGVATTPVGGIGGVGLALLVQPDGKILLGGRSQVRVAVARYLNDPKAAPAPAPEGGTTGGTTGDSGADGDAGDETTLPGDSSEEGVPTSGGCSLIR